MAGLAQNDLCKIKIQHCLLHFLKLVSYLV